MVERSVSLLVRFPVLSVWLAFFGGPARLLGCWLMMSKMGEKERSGVLEDGSL